MAAQNNTAAYINAAPLTQGPQTITPPPTIQDSDSDAGYPTNNKFQRSARRIDATFSRITPNSRSHTRWLAYGQACTKTYLRSACNRLPRAQTTRSHQRARRHAQKLHSAFQTMNTLQKGALADRCQGIAEFPEKESREDISLAVLKTCDTYREHGEDGDPIDFGRELWTAHHVAVRNLNKQLKRRRAAIEEEMELKERTRALRERLTSLTLHRSGTNFDIYAWYS